MNRLFCKKPKYQINYNNILPDSFIIYEGKNNYVDLKTVIDIYGYNNYQFDYKKEIKIQYLDSNPEKIF